MSDTDVRREPGAALSHRQIVVVLSGLPLEGGSRHAEAAVFCVTKR